VWGSRRVGPAADLHDRLAPAEGGRRRVRDRARHPPRDRPADPRRQRRRCARSGTRRPTTRPRWPASTRPVGPSPGGRADPVRLRGQRPRHLRADTPTLDRDTFGGPAGPALRPRRRRARRGLGRVGAASTLPQHAAAPVFLHLDTVRLWGHAGSDVELAYRSLDEIEATEARDPILAHRPAAGRAGRGARRAAAPHRRPRRVRAAAPAEAASRKPPRPWRSSPRSRRTDPTRSGRAAHRPRALDPAAVGQLRCSDLPEDATAPTRRTLAAHLNAALHDELLRRPRCSCSARTSAARAASTASPPGCRSGSGTRGCSTPCSTRPRSSGSPRGRACSGCCRPGDPVPRLPPQRARPAARRGCSTSFFSAGQLPTPMVVRIAGLAYQKGFGGHFHNDNAIGALRDIPGLVLAVPSRGTTRSGCCAAASRWRPRRPGRLPRTDRALPRSATCTNRATDGWLTTYPPLDEVLLPGRGGCPPPGRDRRAARHLRQRRPAVAARGAPARRGGDRLPRARPALADAPAVDALEEHAAAWARSWWSTSAARPVVASRTRSRDSYVPLGPAADLVLVQEEDVVAAVRALP
jgi:2-oxoisovalerate dehydrogenase E1 component